MYVYLFDEIENNPFLAELFEVGLSGRGRVDREVFMKRTGREYRVDKNAKMRQTKMRRRYYCRQSARETFN